MNNIKNNLLLFLLCMCFSLFFCTDVRAETIDNPKICYVNNDNNIMPLADNIRWRYKSINGVLYKRQYNYTAKIWIGKWVKA